MDMTKTRKSRCTGDVCGFPLASQTIHRSAACWWILPRNLRGQRNQTIKPRPLYTAELQASTGADPADGTRKTCSFIVCPWLRAK